MTVKIILLIVIFGFMLAAFLLTEMLLQARKLKVSNQEFFFSDDERENPLRFALISDIHVSKLPIHWDYIGTMISKQNPDFLVIAGDLVFSPQDGPDALEFLKVMVNFTDCEIFVTYGNHDNTKTFDCDEGRKKAYTREIESISSRLHVLENKTEELTIRGRKVRICGVEDYRTVSDAENVKKNLPIKKEGFKSLLVSHNPDILELLPEGCADMAVFGHYHDGQVKLPFRAEFKVLRRDDILANKGYIYGRYEYKQIPIYITSGLGNANLPIRFKSVPEIAVIDF